MDWYIYLEILLKIYKVLDEYVNLYLLKNFLKIFKYF